MTKRIFLALAAIGLSANLIGGLYLSRQNQQLAQTRDEITRHDHVRSEHWARNLEIQAEVNQLFLVGSGLDLLLILLFVAFFFYEQVQAARLQKIMARTLTQVERTNQQMRLALDANRAKFKTVVHDLKNPLGSIRGFAELLQEKAENRDSVQQMAGIIQKISNSTLALVGTVLQEAKVSEEPQESIDLLQCLRDVAFCLSPIATEKEQVIRLEGPEDRRPFLLGARQRVSDIFFNIIGNALKFSPPGSQIWVSWHPTEVAGRWEIRVRDQGPGFAREDFHRLFLPESVLSAKPTGRETSTGLGLYSVRHSLDILGGNIEILNNEGPGACVRLVFPVQEVMRAPDRDARLVAGLDLV